MSENRKMQYAEILSKLTGEAPIILFDDALSEIDKRRQIYVMNEIADMQVMLTCCDPIVALDARIGNLYAIQRGEIVDFVDNLRKMIKINGCVIDTMDMSKVRKLEENK
jgi:ABC-type cobalamin/Fe3+-siderophores transport system ATPase subunit